MTVGKDVSGLFPDILVNMVSQQQGESSQGRCMELVCAVCGL